MTLDLPAAAPADQRHLLTASHRRIERVLARALPVELVEGHMEAEQFRLAGRRVEHSLVRAASKQDLGLPVTVAR